MSPSSFIQAPKGVDHYLKHLYYDTAMLGDETQLRCFLDYIPQEKILFGTDSPNAVITGMLELLNQCDAMTDEKRELIFHKNALNLFPRLADNKIR